LSQSPTGVSASRGQGKKQPAFHSSHKPWQPRACLVDRTVQQQTTLRLNAGVAQRECENPRYKPTVIYSFNGTTVLLEKLTGSRLVHNSPAFCIRTYKCPSPVPIRNQIERVHTSTFHFLKIHLNVIRPSTPGSSKWSLSFRFPHQNPVCTSPLTPYVLHDPPLSCFSIRSPAQYWVSSTDH
jgi:hypothetical protein